MKNPNQYGSVFKMSGKRRNPYRIRKMIGRTPEGKPIYINIGYAKTRAEGMMMLAEYNINPHEEKAKVYTFKEVADMYMEVAIHQLTKVSIKNVKSHLNRMASLNDTPINQIKTLHLQNTINELNGNHRSKANVKATIGQVFTFALQNDLIDKNYVEFVKINKDTEDKVERDKLFSIEEIKRTMNSNNVNFDVVKVLLHTGLRITELLEVKHENVNLEEGYIRGGKKTEAGKDRIVPISKHIREVVEKHYNLNNKYLFVNQINVNIKYSGFRKWFVENYKNNVIHDTRHTFITKMSETNANLSSVKRIVGHSSKDITERVYTHKSIEQLREAMDEFDAYMDELYK